MSGGTGDMDIRLPMGLMFTIIGVIIAGYGIATSGAEMYNEHSLGININLVWGIVMAGFWRRDCSRLAVVSGISPEALSLGTDRLF